MAPRTGLPGQGVLSSLSFGVWGEGVVNKFYGRDQIHQAAPFKGVDSCVLDAPFPRIPCTSPNGMSCTMQRYAAGGPILKPPNPCVFAGTPSSQFPLEEPTRWEGLNSKAEQLVVSCHPSPPTPRPVRYWGQKVRSIIPGKSPSTTQPHNRDKVVVS